MKALAFVQAKFIPKLLNFTQKLRRMEVAQESVNKINEDPKLLKRIITVDKT